MFTTERDYGLHRTLVVRVGMGEKLILRIRCASRRLPQMPLSGHRELNRAASKDEGPLSRAVRS